MIYICTHKPDSIPYSLQYTHTIINNSYSDLSEEYRHLRGMQQIYFMDNLPNEIGIFQNRRYMDISDIPSGYDMVVPIDNDIDSELSFNYTIKHQFENCHNTLKKDFEIIENILGEDFIKYINMVHSKNNPCCFWHNIFIMRKNDFLDYCKFLFDTLHKYEIVRNIYNLKNYPSICFLAERIGSYWIYKYPGKKFLKEVITL